MRASEVQTAEDAKRYLISRVDTFSRRCWRVWDKHPSPSNCGIITERVSMYILELKKDALYRWLF